MLANRADLAARLPVLAIAVYLTSAVDLYLFEAYGIPPLFGQLAALSYLLANLAGATLISGPSRLEIGRDGLAALGLIALYALWTVISFLYSAQSDAVVEVLTLRIKAALFATVFALTFGSKSVRDGFVWAAAALAVLGALLNIQDFFSPTYSVVPGRAAGLYLNPNESGMMLIFLGLIASMRLRATANYLLWSLISIGVLLTFSRGAWLFLFVSVVGLVVAGRLGGGRGRFVYIFGVALVLVFVYSAYLSGDLYIWAARSSLGEYLDPNTLARIGAKGAEIDDYSALERNDVLNLGIRTFLDSPFLGRGVGYTVIWEERVSTHNMTVLLAAELGGVGVMLYLALFAVLILRARGMTRLLASVYFGTGFFSHNQLDNIASVIVLGYIIASIEPSRIEAGIVREKVRSTFRTIPASIRYP